MSRTSCPSNQFLCQLCLKPLPRCFRGLLQAPWILGRLRPTAQFAPARISPLPKSNQVRDARQLFEGVGLSQRVDAPTHRFPVLREVTRPALVDPLLDRVDGPKGRIVLGV